MEVNQYFKFLKKIQYFLSNFDHSYLGNKFTYLAQTQRITTTDEEKSLFKSDQNLFICIYATQV